MTAVTTAFLAGIVVGYLVCHAVHFLHRVAGPESDPDEDHRDN